MTNLAQYLTDTGTRQAEFARAVGVKPGYLHDLLSGRRTPGLSVALRIAEATDGRVPVTIWSKSSSEKAPRVEVQ